MISETLDGLAWSIAGFCVGFWVSDLYWYWRHVRGVADEKRRLMIRQVWSQRAVVVLLIGLALITTIVGFLQARSDRISAEIQREIANDARSVAVCQTHFNRQVIKVISERARLADADRRAMIALVQGVLTGRTEEARRHALEEFVEGAEERSKVRSELPVPKQINCASVVRRRDARRQ